jgi:hypothetical protein
MGIFSAGGHDSSLEVISILCPETDGTGSVQRSKFSGIQKDSITLGHTMDIDTI